MEFAFIHPDSFIELGPGEKFTFRDENRHKKYITRIRYKLNFFLKEQQHFVIDCENYKTSVLFVILKTF